MRRGLVGRYVGTVALLCALVPAVAHAATVAGVVFDDLNGDGALRPGESGVADWVVYIDADADGVLDNPAGANTCTAAASERCVVTDANGAFRFDGLTAGMVQLRTVLQSGWGRTGEEARDLILRTDDSVIDDVGFAVFRLGTAAGVTFDDVDGDGVRDPGEPGVPNWTVFADDTDLDGNIDPGEPTAYSGGDGSYALHGLALGDHSVRVRTRCGVRQTLPPPPGRYVLSIGVSGQLIDGRDFGLQRPSVIPGDGDGDGIVTAADIVAVVRAIGTVPMNGNDLNGDLLVNGVDVAATAVNVFDCAGIAAGTGGPPETVTATPSVTATAVDSATPVGATATASATPPPATATATGVATATATNVPTSTATGVSTATSSVTRSVTATPTATSTSVASSTPSATATLPPAATSTATITRTPTATNAPTPDGEALAGTAAQIANGMNAIPAVITALVSGIKFGALTYDPDADPLAQLSGIGGPAGACPLSGTATRTCNTAGAQGTLSVAFNSCRIPTASGSVTVDELPPTDPAVSLKGGICIGNVALPPWAATIGVSAVFRDALDAQLLTATAALTGSINPAIGGSCSATGATLTISGTIRTQFADGSATSLVFTNTGVVVAVSQFNAQCVPVKYTMTFNGPATVTVSPPPGLARGAAEGSSTAVVFTNFVVSQDATQSPTRTELDGGLGAACAGAQLTLDTTEPLAQTVGAQCPVDGILKISAGGSTTQLFYLAGGAVGVDSNNDGSADSQLASCREAPPLCGGGAATPTATRTPTVTATRTATAGVTATATATATITNTVPVGSTATATATRTNTPPNTLTATATPTATPTATIGAAEVFCDTLPGPALIPDNDSDGISNTITVPSGATIADLNVALNITHTFPGDLLVSLTHVNTGKTVVLLDRPGFPTFANGCGRDDIDAVFDDASLRPVESRCANGPPLAAAIDGSVKPEEPLSGFNGENIAGTWRLDMSDLAFQDTGSLISWCLRPNSPDPVITQFTCGNGDTECLVVVNDPFQLSFSYVDPNGDAATWQITGRRDDGFEFDAGNGTLPSGSASTVPLDFSEFTCPTQDCPDTDFDYFLTIADSAGHQSPTQRLRLTVTLIAL